MKKRTIILWLLCISTAISSLCFSSCGKQKTKFSRHSMDYFDTVTTITSYAESVEAFNDVCTEILGMLEEYHKLFTIYERYEGVENLFSVNSLENGVHPTVHVDQKIIDLLLYAKEMYTKTDGKVNIAMGSVLSVWHNYREVGIDDPASAVLPPRELLSEAAKHTNIEDILIDEVNLTVTLTDPDMLLDVGAIAKGYAVEQIAKTLEEKGISGYVINVGGNVRTVGTKANGEKWTVGIEHPNGTSEDPYAAYIATAGESVVTSGSYQRYYVVDGQRYHHIIDPETLFPSETYLSVSVICKNSAEGDALSTALFCMSAEEGLALVESLDGIEAMWILPSGEKRYSEGFSDYMILP